MRAWLEEAACLLEAAGLLRLYALRRHGEILAGILVLAAKGQMHFYIGGFDPDHARLSPGTILVGHAIAEAERAGMKGFGFLRGQEPYKYRWGAQDEQTYSRLLIPPAGSARACTGLA
jgi:CelD/BcsL family acetyltransferase involved in cellulose biosynthesis